MTKKVDTLETWVLGWREIRERLVAVLRFKAALYVMTFVWFFGGTGVWLAAIMNQNGGAAPRDLYLSVLTFSLAVSVSGAFDGTLAPATTGTMRMLAFAFISVAIVVPIVPAYHAFYAATDEWNSTGIVVPGWYPLVGTSPSVFVWLFFNGAEERFAPDTPATAAGGGDPLRPIG